MVEQSDIPGPTLETGQTQDQDHSANSSSRASRSASASLASMSGVAFQAISPLVLRYRLASPASSNFRRILAKSPVLERPRRPFFVRSYSTSTQNRRVGHAEFHARLNYLPKSVLKLKMWKPRQLKTSNLRRTSQRQLPQLFIRPRNHMKDDTRHRGGKKRAFLPAWFRSFKNLETTLGWFYGRRAEASVPKASGSTWSSCLPKP
jgi:hypothetical protein